MVLFIAVLVPYLFQWYRSHYLSETIFDDISSPENLVLHSEEFDEPSVLRVSESMEGGSGTEEMKKAEENG